MSVVLLSLVKQRLTAAAEEIFVLFERTIAEYEEELSRSKQENERHRKLLDAVLQPQLQIHRAAKQHRIGESRPQPERGAAPVSPQCPRGKSSSPQQHSTDGSRPPLQQYKTGRSRPQPERGNVQATPQCPRCKNLLSTLAEERQPCPSLSTLREADE
ncbi:hypothetical protein NQZ68_039529 [Dissostichus eleginoides]|nr:hypothetical protein NQZ68_039529 [Dissostichus eleginoides]